MRNTIGRLPPWLVALVSFMVLVLGVYFIIQLAPLFLEGVLFEKSSKSIPPAPNFSLLDLDGEEVSLSNFKGRRVIINFWTSWNEISLEQLKDLNNYYASGFHEDLVILMINSQEDAETVRDVSENYAAGPIMLLDTAGEAGYAYDISVVPLTAFVDRNGFLKKTVVGPISFEEMNDYVKEL